jgi:hypothetical protein
MIYRLSIALLVLLPVFAEPGAAPSRDEVMQGMRKAASFYLNKVSTHGGYQFNYADDLSYSRSEMAEGPTQVSVQRQGTPTVGMAYLEAWDDTHDPLFLEAARAAAHGLIEGQQCTGGWAHIIEFDPEKRAHYPYRADNNCQPKDPGGRHMTVMDDNITQAAVRLLMRVDRALAFKDSKIHEAVLFALDSLLKAQYPNGAWPQRYDSFPDPAKFPVKRASYPESWPRTWPGPTYQSYYTFNDNSIADDIDMMLEAARIYNDPRYLASAKRGGDFILLAQMPEPQPAWAQQYDADMHPAWARVFEPPSVTGGESQGVMQILMVLYRETGDRKYLDAVGPALKYLKSSAIPPPHRPIEAYSRVRGTPVLARFYELKTNRPLYITKGTRVSVKGMSTKLADGYEISYSPDSVITHYNVLTSGAKLADIEAEYKRLVATDPAKIRRADKLHGLSPWELRERPEPAREQLAQRVRAILAEMDSRGAWVEEGRIGKADRLISLFAAHDMVITVNGRELTPLRENGTLEVFEGPKPPRAHIIRSTTFARNLEILGTYLKQFN